MTIQAYKRQYQIVPALQRALLVALIGLTAPAAWAQLTTEQLIGSAVSLSNKDYPEVDKAIQRFLNSDAKGALEYLNLAKEKYPKLPPTNVTFAKMQMAARNARAVRILLERAVIESPDDPEAYLLLADQAFQGNRITESAALFEFAAPLIESFTENSKRKRNFETALLAGRAAIAERRNDSA